MKRKPKLGPRNPLVAPSKFRKAGLHIKTAKALRRGEAVKHQRRITQMGKSNRLLTGRFRVPSSMRRPLDSKLLLT